MAHRLAGNPDPGALMGAWVSKLVSIGSLLLHVVTGSNQKMVQQRSTHAEANDYCPPFECSSSCGENNLQLCSCFVGWMSQSKHAKRFHTHRYQLDERISLHALVQRMRMAVLLNCPCSMGLCTYLLLTSQLLQQMPGGGGNIVVLP